MSGQLAFALLHGGGQGSWVWHDVAELLEAAGARVLSLDAPGCGAKRGRDTSEIGVAAVVADLLHDIDAARHSQVVLVGHSQAGTILPLLAEAQPQRIRQLIHVSTCAPLPGQSILEMMGNCLQGTDSDVVGRPLDPATADHAAQTAAMFCNDMDPAMRADFLSKLGKDGWPMASMTYRDWRYDHLGALPSSYILCDRDCALPPSWQLRFAERLHAGRVIHIDAGHQPMTTQPAKLAELLLAEAIELKA
jgi:pimeloyl-ACP methyl ester carboxylesterase